MPRVSTDTWRSPLQRKRARHYHRLLSGVKRASALGETLRVMTLTSSYESVDGKIRADFQILRKRMIRRFKFDKFEYCMISTSEGKVGARWDGHNVLHIIYKGAFIPFKWLQLNWKEIHGAHHVRIQKLYGTPKRLAGYLIGYLGHHSISRLSWSWGWVCRGFVGIWKDFYKYFGYPSMMNQWDIWIAREKLVDLKKHIFWDKLYDTGQETLDSYCTNV